MRRLGARAEVGGEGYDAAIFTAHTFAEQHGLRFVQDGRDAWIAAGAATMAVEVTEAGVVPDVALVPVGNSALILGIARWLGHSHSGIRVGVCAPSKHRRQRCPGGRESPLLAAMRRQSRTVSRCENPSPNPWPG